MIAWWSHGGTEAWAPPPAIRAHLDRQVAGPVEVHYWHRADLPHAWAASAKGPMPAFPPYAFRAWANPDRGVIHILVDDTESQASALWVLLHELCHVELRRSSYIEHGLAQKPPRPAAYYTSDAVHQADPEERVCDWLATRWYRSLRAPPPDRRDRMWWRRNVNAKRAGGTLRAAG